MPLPELKPVTSRHIEAEAYDPDTQTLYLQFRGGRVYRYNNVPAKIHEDFLSAESKGKFFGASIKNDFTDYEKLSEAAALSMRPAPKKEE